MSFTKKVVCFNNTEFNQEILFCKTKNQKGLRVVVRDQDKPVTMTVMDGKKKLEVIKLKKVSQLALMGTVEALVEKYF